MCEYHSPFWMIQFDTATTLHQVGKYSQFIWVSSVWRSKMTLWSCAILWVLLRSKGRSNIICLVSISFGLFSICTTSLRKGPSWQILLVWWFSTVFWEISAWSYTVGGSCMILQNLSSSESERIFLWDFVNRFFFRKILRTWLWVNLSIWKSRLGTYLGC